MISIKENVSHVMDKKPEDELKVGIDFMDTSLGDYGIIGHFHYTIHPKKESAFIDSVYLQEDYRKTGILKSNIDKIICGMSCRGVSNIGLHAQTEQAKTIWEKSGFEVIGEETIEEEGVPLHYYIMKKDISSIVCKCNKRR